MAEANFNEFVAGGNRPRAMSNGTVNVIGAITTLALITGVAVWGYKLAVRDASGVPVIQAMEGPMRSAPDNPGGRIASHTGLSVNRIAADGTAAPLPDQLMLAEAPMELEPEDAAGIGTAAPAPVVESDTAARTLAMAEELARQVAAEVAAMTGDDLVDAVASSAAAATLVTDGEPAFTFPAGTVETSLRPPPRPARLAGGSDLGTRAALTPASASGTDALNLTTIVPISANADVEIDLASIAPGTRLAQIGAFDDPEAARAEWSRITARHPALFEGKQRVIQTATSVGRTFYRLRVSSFGSEDDTRRFCSAITAPDLRCISVTMR